MSKPRPILRAKYPSLAVWKWGHKNPVFWQAFNALNGTSVFEYDDQTSGKNRQYAPDGGQHPMFIIGVDKDGRAVTEPSNIVVPDDAPVE